MSKADKYQQFNKEIQSEVEQEIIKVKEGVSKKNLNQLNKIIRELQIMENKKGYNVNYPKFIIDSWDYSDRLGDSLLQLFELYKKL